MHYDKNGIKVSTTPEAFGEVSDNLKNEVKTYARRCNLIYPLKRN